MQGFPIEQYFSYITLLATIVCNVWVYVIVPVGQFLRLKFGRRKIFVAKEAKTPPLPNEKGRIDPRELREYTQGLKPEYITEIEKRKSEKAKNPFEEEQPLFIREKDFNSEWDNIKLGDTIKF